MTHITRQTPRITKIGILDAVAGGATLELSTNYADNYTYIAAISVGGVNPANGTAKSRVFIGTGTIPGSGTVNFVVTGGLLKQGWGDLIFGNQVTANFNNSYLNITNGALEFSTTDFLSTVGQVSLSPNGTGNNPTLRYAGTSAASYAGPVILNGGTIEVVNSSFTLNGLVSSTNPGAMALVKKGAGMLVLDPRDVPPNSMANTFIGGVSIEAGVLSAVGTNALGDPGNRIYLGTTTSSATLQIQDPFVGANPPVLPAQQPSDQNMGTRVIEVRDGGGIIDVQSRSLTIGAAGGLVNTPLSIAPGALTKIGPGVLNLANNFTGFLGGLNVNVGAVALSDAGGAGTGTVRIGGGLLVSNTAAPVASTIVLNSGNLGSTGGNREFSGSITVNADPWNFSAADPNAPGTDRITNLSGAAAGAVVSLQGDVVASGAGTGLGGLYFSNTTNPPTLAAGKNITIANGGGVHVAYDGTNYSLPVDRIIMQSGGILGFRSDNKGGDTDFSALWAGVTANPGTDLSGNYGFYVGPKTASPTSPAILTLNTTLTVASGKMLTVAGANSSALDYTLQPTGLTLLGDATLNLAGGNLKLLVDNPFSSPGNLTIQGSANGKLILDSKTIPPAAPWVLNNTTLNGGTVQLGNGNTLQSASLAFAGGSLSLGANATAALGALQMSGGSITGAVGSLVQLTGGAQIQYNGAAPGATAATIATNVDLGSAAQNIQVAAGSVPAPQLTISGNLLNGTSLNVAGGGAVALTGAAAASFPGNVTVQGNSTLGVLGGYALTTPLIHLDSGKLHVGGATSVVTGFGGFAAPNGSASIASNVLTLTTAVNGEAGSAYYNTKVPLSSLDVWFTYTHDMGGGAPADGITLTMQNQGTNALGGGGGALGYQGIGNSAAAAISIYDPGGYANGRAAFLSGGGNPNASLQSTGTFNLRTIDPYRIHVWYDGANLHETITDTTTSSTYTATPMAMNLAAVTGASTAWVGFTGGTGGLNALQQISNLQFGTPAASTTLATTVHVSGSSELGIDNTLLGTVNQLNIDAGATLNVTSNLPAGLAAAQSLATYFVAAGAGSPTTISGDTPLMLGRVFGGSDLVNTLVLNVTDTGGMVFDNNSAATPNALNNAIINATGGTVTVRTAIGGSNPLGQAVLNIGSGGTFRIDGSGTAGQTAPAMLNSVSFLGNGTLMHTGASNDVLGGATTVLTIDGPVAANIAGGLTINGRITGPAGITLTGSGVLTLSDAAGATTANDFAGDTVVNGATLNLSKAANTQAIGGTLRINGVGTVNINADNQLPAGNSAVTMSGGLLNVNGNTQILNSLTMTGGAIGGYVPATGNGQVILTVDPNFSSLASGATATIGAKVNLNAAAPRIFSVPSGATVMLTAPVTNGAIEKDDQGLLVLGNGPSPAVGSDYKGGTVVNSGQLSIYGNNSLGAATSTLTLRSGTKLGVGYMVPGWAPGLVESRILPDTTNQFQTNTNPGVINTGGTGGGHPLGFRMGNTNATTEGTTTPNTWNDNDTWIYKGWYYDADGQFAIGENIDDSVRVWVNGTLRLANDTWNQPTTTGSNANNPNGGTTNFGMGPNGDGWHLIEVRMFNGGGGAGAVDGTGWSGASKGLAINPGLTPTALANLNSTDGQYYTILADPGNASLLRYQGFVATKYTGNLNDVYVDPGSVIMDLSANTGDTQSLGVLYAGSGRTINVTNDNGNANQTLTFTGADMDPVAGGPAIYNVAPSLTLNLGQIDPKGVGNNMVESLVIGDPNVAGTSRGGNVSFTGLLKVGTTYVNPDPGSQMVATIIISGGTLSGGDIELVTPKDSNNGSPFSLIRYPGNGNEPAAKIAASNLYIVTSDVFLAGGRSGQLEVNVGQGANNAGLEISSAIHNGGITKTGPGTLILSGVSNYAGGTNITEGVVQAIGTAPLGTGPVRINANTALSVRGISVDTTVVRNVVGRYWNYGAGDDNNIIGASTPGASGTLTNFSNSFNLTGTGTAGAYAYAGPILGGITTMDFSHNGAYDNWQMFSAATGNSFTNNNNIVARFDGQIKFPQTGTYTFSTTSDDGSMVWINGNEVVYNNNWQGATTHTGTFSATAGVWTNITVGYYEGGGGNGLLVQWAGPGITAGVLPIVPSAANLGFQSTNDLYVDTGTQSQPAVVDLTTTDNGQTSTLGVLHCTAATYLNVNGPGRSLSLAGTSLSGTPGTVYFGGDANIYLGQLSDGDPNPNSDGILYTVTDVGSSSRSIYFNNNTSLNDWSNVLVEVGAGKTVTAVAGQYDPLGGATFHVAYDPGNPTQIGTFAIQSGTVAGNVSPTITADGSLRIAHTGALADTFGISSSILKAGNVASGSTLIIDVAAPGSLAIFSQIQDGDAGSLAVQKVNAGTAILSGSLPNTFSGLTTVSAGTLRLSKTAGVTAVHSVAVNSGALLTQTANEQIADTSDVTITKGTWDLGGNTETINNLNLTQAVVQNGTVQFNGQVNKATGWQTSEISAQLGKNAPGATVNVSAGTLRLSHNTGSVSNLGAPAAGVVNITDNAHLGQSFEPGGGGCHGRRRSAGRPDRHHEQRHTHLCRQDRRQQRRRVAGRHPLRQHRLDRPEPEELPHPPERSPGNQHQYQRRAQLG